jgi:dTDP-4-dehydrorhamnose 3,5-epimerase
MRFEPLPLEGAYLVHPEPRQDERGFFARIFAAEEFSAYGLATRWVHINNSRSVHQGTLRGLHFQRAPRAECKLVRCIDGVIWDVVVDLRRGSPTFGRWYGTTLSAENRLMMYVPEGFAHGCLSLSDGAEIIYPSSQPYSAVHEGSLHWADPAVAIEWPVRPTIVSDKDATAPCLADIEPLELQP